MSPFLLSLKRRVESGLKAFQVFPITMLFAFLFSVVTGVRIQLDWPQQESLNFLLSCLHLSFAFGALVNLMLNTWVSTRIKDFSKVNTTKLIMNGVTLLIVGITFTLLFAFGDYAYPGDSLQYVSSLAMTRIVILCMISVLLFIYFIGSYREEIDFSGSLFMSHKSFIIAGIYGLAIMGGTSAVAGAIQALLYQDMSSKVYMYLGTIAGFIAFSLFVGYFPELGKEITDPRWESVQKQPRFIEILIELIAVPILLALTVVLLLWIGKTIFTQDWPEFYSIQGILSWFSIVGIWLFLLHMHLNKGIGKIFRWAYPIALMGILLFGIVALIRRLNEFGMKEDEYVFILLIIDGFVIGFLLLKWLKKAVLPIIVILVGTTVFAILPFVGYYDLTTTIQIAGLEKNLTDLGILNNNELTPVTFEPSENIRIRITDSINYLTYKQNINLPEWFTQDLNTASVFERELGFAQVYPNTPDYVDQGNTNLYVSMNLGNGTMHIADYDWVAYVNEKTGNDQRSGVMLDGKNGSYEIVWIQSVDSKSPTIKVLLDGTVIIEENLRDAFESKRDVMVSNSGKESVGDQFKAPEDMTITLETDQIKLMLLFDYMSYAADPQRDTLDYYFNVNSIYIKEK